METYPTLWKIFHQVAVRAAYAAVSVDLNIAPGRVPGFYPPFFPGFVTSFSGACPAAGGAGALSLPVVFYHIGLRALPARNPLIVIIVIRVITTFWGVRKMLENAVFSRGFGHFMQKFFHRKMSVFHREMSLYHREMSLSPCKAGNFHAFFASLIASFAFAAAIAFCLSLSCWRA